MRSEDGLVTTLREYITKNFVGASGARNLRDGIGFLRWVESFFDISKEQAQINIKKDFTSKMKMSPSDASRDTMEKSWLDGLSLWKTVNGNNEFDRVSLQTFYVAIRDGLRVLSLILLQRSLRSRLLLLG